MSGQFAQRNIGVRAGRRLVADLDVANLVEIAAIFAGQPHGHAELAVGFQQRGRGGAAQGGLNHAVDIAGVEPVPRRIVTIYLDVEVGLPEDRKHAEVRHAFDARHFFQDLLEIASSVANPVQ